MAKQFYHILCKPEVMECLDREEFAVMLASIFYDIFSPCVEFPWLAKYCKTILEILKGLEQYKLPDRAQRYYDHIKRTMIPEFSSKVKLKNGDMNGYLNSLTDIYKMSACLLDYLDSDSAFTTDVTREMLEHLENRIVSMTKNGSIDYLKEEQVYAMFFSWPLIEIVCEQDGIFVKEGDEE